MVDLLLLRVQPAPHTGSIKSSSKSDDSSSRNAAWEPITNSVAPERRRDKWKKGDVKNNNEKGGFSFYTGSVRGFHWMQLQNLMYLIINITQIHLFPDKLCKYNIPSCLEWITNDKRGCWTYPESKTLRLQLQPTRTQVETPLQPDSSGEGRSALCLDDDIISRFNSYQRLEVVDWKKY